jgi:tetratricopeptide (TPR) repeat protein
MTEAESAEHNRLFKEAADIAMKEIQLHDRPQLPAPGWLLRRKLDHVLKLFNKVLQLKPENWSAMWLMGKVHQRLQNKPEALEWFGRAYQVNPSHPDVAREASMSAMELGQNDDAIAYAYRAAQITPQDHGLLTNLALAYLLAGQIDHAKTCVEQSLAGSPDDKISQTIAAMIRHFASSGSAPPNTTPALSDYWRKCKTR